MTESHKLTGATANLGGHWKAIDWLKAESEVKRLQMRIAKTVREGNKRKVKSLQWLLSHSFYAKLLATRRVSSNKGARTPGVDGVLWNTPARKMRGALTLQRRGYKALPLRRICIDKKNGKKRPLGIPTFKDRAMQALYLMTLEPVAETLGDPNSYGFRPFRACRDAIAQSFMILSKRNSAKWILEGDIKACFDEISHDWLLENVALDKRMLQQWLKCGYIDNRKLFPTKSGTPQGGIISPVLANLTLDDLEEVVKKSCPSRSKVNFIRYADDFIVTAAEKELLEERVVPAINAFLKPRGLELAPEKTGIVRIEEGFDFLGQNVRKYKEKFIRKPSKDNVNSIVRKIAATIKKHRGNKAEDMIRELNHKIRGWCNYHRYIQSSRAFGYVGTFIFHSLWRWSKQRYPKKNAQWIYDKHFRDSKRNWGFSCCYKDEKGNRKHRELISPYSVKLVRYIKIRGGATPFDPEYTDYFKKRKVSRNCKPLPHYNLTVGTPVTG